MASKDTYQTFQSDWAKTVSWAQSQKISPNVYMPVYQADSKRLMQYGSIMGQGERIQAINAAAGMNAPNKLPTDNPNPTHIIENTKKNLQQIFTGLSGIPSSIFDTVTHTISDPIGTIFKPAMDLAEINQPFFGDKNKAMKDFTERVLGRSSPWAFVPGAMDAAYAYQGVAGFKHLAENPISSILDVIPLTRIPMKLIARTDRGAILAEKAGLHPNELGKMGPGQLGWKIMKKGGTFDRAGKPKMERAVTLPDGSKKIMPMNRGERMDAWRNAHGMGRVQGEFNKEVVLGSEEGTRFVKSKWEDAAKLLGRLDSTSQKRIFQTVESDHRSDSEILGDSSFTKLEREALDAVFEWGQWNYQLKLQNGELVEIETPFIGPDGNHIKEAYLVTPGSSGAKLLSLKEAAHTAETTLQSRAEGFDGLVRHSQNIDTMLNAQIERMVALKNNVHESIKASLPDLPDSPATHELRHSMSASDKWDRSVLKSANLESYLGLDERIEQRITRGSSEVEPFSGLQNSWSEEERSAWIAARDELRPQYVKDPPQSAIKENALSRLKTGGLLRDQKVHAAVPLAAARILKEVVGPGGFLEQAAKAYEDQDWESLRKIAQVMDKKLSGKSFQSPNQAPALTQIREVVDGLKQFSEHRKKVMDKMNRLWYGKDAKGTISKAGAKNSLEALTKKSATANEKFLSHAIHHAPDVWRSAFLDEYTNQVKASESGARIVDEAAKVLKGEGWTESELDKLRSDPRAIMEMVSLSSKVSFENPMLPNFSFKESREISESVYKELARLRATGARPRYIPNATSFDIRRGDKPFNVFLKLDKIPSVASAKERAFDFGSTIYDLQASMLKDTREIVARDSIIELIDRVLTPYLFDMATLEPQLLQRLRPYTDQIAGPTRGATVQNMVEQELTNLNLTKFDPAGLFGMSVPRFHGKAMYMDKDLLNGLTQAVNKFQYPAQHLIDKITHVFRTSILGYSPRFMAHIIVGGTVLLAGRSSVKSLAHINEMFHFVHTGEFPEKLAAELGMSVEEATKRTSSTLHGSSTQEGAEEIRWQRATRAHSTMLGYSAGQFAVEENIAHEMATRGIDRATAIARWVPDHLVYRSTRYVTNLQRSVALFDGIHKSMSKKAFYMDEVVDGKIVRVKKDMTGDEALDQGMKHSLKVMGDLRAATPFERTWLMRAMPFWGWTSHVLKYVLSYPVDHPYRAMFLSNLAQMNSENVATGLPLRTQLLFFLGSPDRSGNVTTVDVRAANPLRDTANYASWSGWISAINPAFTAPVSMVDPQFTFGGNVMYPSITYSSLYGTKEAGATGTPWTAAEAVVPEVAGLDQALNLSGQYAYLRQKGNSSLFIKKMAESLNFPWIPQNMNLYMTAAKGEMDRYMQAKQAAHNAWTSGDFSQLAGYGSVPDPRNPQYEVDPKYLESVYKQTLSQSGGLPPSTITKPLPSPSY